MNIGIINAFPMSLVTKNTTLCPNHGYIRDCLSHPVAEILWLWGHKNSSDEAARFLRENYGVVNKQEIFGDRPTVIAEDDGLYAKASNGLLVKIDMLVVLAPKFGGLVERKAEGEIALVNEITGFTPILVIQ